MTGATRQARLRERRKDLHRLDLWISPESAEMLKALCRRYGMTQGPMIEKLVREKAAKEGDISES
ncbi:RepB family protein [Desulfomicrobium apsheronum]|uniref:RepB family protein n=1 Tax=Desulfomicrobium apsheronum TaxID=52560 RepID=UPI000B887FCE|nr:RepB family protein [Desulfomicrobium apsheronum]